MSIIQAGAAYHFFSNAMFQYLCGKRLNEIEYDVSDIPNPTVREIVIKVM